MAYLTLNGFTVPVRATGATYQRIGVGEGSVAFSGRQQPERRAVVRTFTLQAVVDTVDTSNALAGLIQGDGHHWSFDYDLYSSKGLGPLLGYNVTMTGAGGVVGGFTTVANGASIIYRKIQYGDYTMMVFKKTGGVWRQYAYVFDYGTGTATQYKDGAVHVPGAGDTILNWFSYTTANGDFTLEGADIDGAGLDSPYDGLVIVPYAMTAAMVAAFYTQTFTLGIAFSDLPTLVLAGDIIPDAPKFFVGSVAAGAYEMALVASGDMLGKTVDFTLTEFIGLVT